MCIWWKQPQLLAMTCLILKVDLVNVYEWASLFYFDNYEKGTRDFFEYAQTELHPKYVIDYGIEVVKEMKRPYFQYRFDFGG